MYDRADLPCCLGKIKEIGLNFFVNIFIQQVGEVEKNLQI